MVPVSYDEDEQVLLALDQLALTLKVKRAVVVRWATARFTQDAAPAANGGAPTAAELSRILTAPGASGEGQT